MHNLFTEASTHTGLARTLEQLGQPRFWRQLMLLLQHWVPFDNALAMFYPRAGLPRALEILAARRPPGTPVAVVQDATRPGKNHRVAHLSEFDPEWVDMHSIVIVGSSTTRMVPTAGAERGSITRKKMSL